MDHVAPDAEPVRGGDVPQSGTAAGASRPDEGGARGTAERRPGEPTFWYAGNPPAARSTDNGPAGQHPADQPTPRYASNQPTARYADSGPTGPHAGNQPTGPYPADQPIVRFTGNGPAGTGDQSTAAVPPLDPADGVREVLESGVERSPGDGGRERLTRAARRWWRGTGAATPWRRRAVAATAALAAAGVLVVLRAAAPTVPAEDEAAAAASAPVIIYGRARMQPPPFDRLPGRTPIPQPSPIGRPAEAVRGGLPATGALGEQAARAAARLVLGRYCRYPLAYLVMLEPSRSWRDVVATVLQQTSDVEPHRLTTLRLRWTGHAYAWQGWPAELARCA